MVSENRFIGGNFSSIEIIQDPTYQKNHCRIDMDAALKIYNIDRLDFAHKEARFIVW